MVKPDIGKLAGKHKEVVEKKKSAKEVEKWANSQYKKGKLNGSAWGEYIHKVM